MTNMALGIRTENFSRKFEVSQITFQIVWITINPGGKELL